jgi:hypothetical protein
MRKIAFPSWDEYCAAIKSHFVARAENLVHALFIPQEDTAGVIPTRETI